MLKGGVTLCWKKVKEVKEEYPEMGLVYLSKLPPIIH